MNKYRKKPVVIEADKFLVYNKTVEQICNEYSYCGLQIKEGFIIDFLIPTLEGDMKVTDGDFIIKGIKGEFYPCKPDIFEQTYELVTDEQKQTENTQRNRTLEGTSKES